MENTRDVKKWVNRGGLIAMAIGVIVYIATGGSAATAGEVVTVVAGVTGTVLILIRELLG